MLGRDAVQSLLLNPGISRIRTDEVKLLSILRRSPDIYIMANFRWRGDSTCPSADSLAMYLDGRVDQIERARLEQHFSVCEQCRRILSIAVSTEDTVKAPDESSNNSEK